MPSSQKAFKIGDVVVAHCSGKAKDYDGVEGSVTRVTKSRIYVKITTGDKAGTEKEFAEKNLTVKSWPASSLVPPAGSAPIAAKRDS
eukprot:10692288-Karenia_brevis.AAC.1